MTKPRNWHDTDRATGIILLGVEGPMPYEEWEAAVRAELDRTRPGPRRFLSDRRRLRPASSAEFLERAVGFFRRERELFGPTQWSILSEGQDAVYGSARQVEALAEGTGVHTRAFTDLRAALTWLLPDVDPVELERLVKWVERYAEG